MRTLLALLCLLGLVACKRAAPPAPADAGLALPPPRELSPVYPTTLPGEPEPLARRLCQALHGLAEQRRKSCCGQPAAVPLLGECLRTLSVSLRGGAARLVEAEVAACERAQGELLSGCGWVGPWAAPLSPACRGLIHGTVAPGEACRSALECAEAGPCVGVGPLAMGRCGAPKGDGQTCATAVDPMGSYTRDDDLDRTHPECRGHCERLHRCVPAFEKGAACSTSLQCGSNGRCAAGRCVAGAQGQAGEPCTGGDCAPGLRCHKQRCLRPGEAGAACESDFDCLGGCNRGDGGARCGPKC